MNTEPSSDHSQSRSSASSNVDAAGVFALCEDGGSARRLNSTGAPTADATADRSRARSERSEPKITAPDANCETRDESRKTVLQDHLLGRYRDQSGGIQDMADVRDRLLVQEALLYLSLYLRYLARVGGSLIDEVSELIGRLITGRCVRKRGDRKIQIVDRLVESRDLRSKTMDCGIGLQTKLIGEHARNA